MSIQVSEIGNDKVEDGKYYRVFAIGSGYCDTKCMVLFNGEIAFQIHNTRYLLYLDEIEYDVLEIEKPNYGKEY